MMHMAPWKIWTILVICVLGVIYAAPNFLTREQAAQLPAWLPHQQINLGLDLQGGSHLLLEVVRRRIDETGTLDPTIQIQGQDRILVQLPGVRDPERIKALLGRTAKMN